MACTVLYSNVHCIGITGHTHLNLACLHHILPLLCNEDQFVLRSCHCAEVVDLSCQRKATPW